MNKPRIWKDVKSIVHEWSIDGSGKTIFSPDQLGYVVEKQAYDQLLATAREMENVLQGYESGRGGYEYDTRPATEALESFRATLKSLGVE